MILDREKTRNITPESKNRLVVVGTIGECRQRCLHLTARSTLNLRDHVRFAKPTCWQCENEQTFAHFDVVLETPPDVAIVATAIEKHIAMASKLADVGVHSLLTRISHLIPTTLARDLRQPFENKGFDAFHANVTGEPNG